MVYAGSRKTIGTFSSEVYVSDDQHYTVERRGLSCSVVYSFRGEAWERFFGVLAANGVPSHWAGAFMGASINGRTVSMAQHFAHDRFMANYAAATDGMWQIKRGKRNPVILPEGDKNDSLIIQIGYERTRDFFTRAKGLSVKEVDDGRYCPIKSMDVDLTKTPKENWTVSQWQEYLSEGDAIQKIATGTFLSPFSRIGEERREEYACAFAHASPVRGNDYHDTTHTEYF